MLVTINGEFIIGVSGRIKFMNARSRDEILISRIVQAPCRSNCPKEIRQPAGYDLDRQALRTHAHMTNLLFSSVSFFDEYSKINSSSKSASTLLNVLLSSDSLICTSLNSSIVVSNRSFD